MKKTTTLLLLFLCLTAAWSQEVSVSEARFCKGDDPAYSEASFDDSAWPVLSLEKTWDDQGVRNPNGYGWYRIHVVIPSSLKKGTTDKIVLDLGPIDDTDETWLNGTFVGKTGTNPGDPAGYSSQWDVPRRYIVDAKKVRWDKENVIAVRVYNSGDPGGFFSRPARIGKPVLSDFATVSLKGEKDACRMELRSNLKTSGIVEMTMKDAITEEVLNMQVRPVRLSPKEAAVISWPVKEQSVVSVVYTDGTFGEKLTAGYTVPYILTPPAPATPRYNGPLVFGVRPGSPVIFRLAFSGERPMTYAVEGLPEGVTLDATQGVLSGSVAEKGDYPLVLVARNAHGEARQAFTLKVGDKIALTPPMGWNSWNCWGLSVSQEKVMSSAAALINRGLADYGYSYINVDDAWEAEERAADGRIVCNEKFPDMKGLGDWLHSNGLRLGIYSSPGDRTCGGYLGTLDHEQQDAETWNEWGVDYLKYDWCGYSKVFGAQKDRSVASYIRPYLKMQEFLRQQPRDIFYSLCQYGMADVWTWGPFVDANSWRTTGDITDTWSSLYRIGFELQPELYPYAAPGHWNDPDMLVVGKVGWSDNLRDSRLTPDEQYTHITLWSLLAANMLIGCDIAQIDDFTFNLLCNNEVNAVNQDILGVQAHRDVNRDGIQVWSRPLADGGTAVGIFNLNEASARVNLSEVLSWLGLTGPDTVRDLWRQQDIAVAETYVIPSHGVRFIKVAAGPASATDRVKQALAALHDPDSRYVVVVAHRGDWRGYPENSIPAIESCIRMGVDMMELDLKKTKDGVLVLSHDPTLDRCTTGSGKISDYTYEELRAFDLKAGHGIGRPGIKIPTLREALEVCKDRILVNVDQGYDYYDEVLALAEELGVTDQILIKSGRPWPEVQAKQAGYPHNLMYMPVISGAQEGESLLFQSYVADPQPQLAYELCFNTLNDNVRGMAGKILDSGAKLWVNTIWASLCGGYEDDAAFAAADPGTVYGPILDMGTSILQTDRPEFLIGYLAAQGRH